MFFLIFVGKFMTILQEKSLKNDKYIVILASLLVLNKNERLIWIVSFPFGARNRLKDAFIKRSD